jgi:hypothetical protein
MQTRLRVVLLTGDGLRHRYAASQWADVVQLTGVLSEAKPSSPDTPRELPAEDQAVIRRHFRDRDEAERRRLGERSFPDAADVLGVPRGGSNSPDAVAWVRRHEPDLIVLYGSGVVKPPLLDEYDGRIVNLHLGLSPYYRGAGTNFWPLADRRPECVGATVHLAVSAVDAGPILAQVRPDIAPTDRAHDIGTKALVAGVQALARVIFLYHAGRLIPVPQDLSRGRVYRRTDFNAEAVRRMARQFESEMISEYLEQRETRCLACPIVERPHTLTEPTNAQAAR